MVISVAELNFESAIDYHYNKFPPNSGSIDYQALIGPLFKATDALARFDQVLKDLHNSESVSYTHLTLPTICSV